MSDIVIKMAQQIICEKNPSPTAIGIADNIVHIAWNFAHKNYKDEHGYIFSVKEIQEKISSVNNELISDDAEKMIKLLMLYKLTNYPTDKRNIVVCEIKNGEVCVMSL